MLAALELARPHTVFALLTSRSATCPFPSFEYHFWRKLCRHCHCRREDHDVWLASDTPAKRAARAAALGQSQGQEEQENRPEEDKELTDGRGRFPATLSVDTPLCERSGGSLRRPVSRQKKEATSRRSPLTRHFPSVRLPVRTQRLRARIRSTIMTSRHVHTSKRKSSVRPFSSSHTSAATAWTLRGTWTSWSRPATVRAIDWLKNCPCDVLAPVS